MMFGHRRLAGQLDAFVDGELELSRLATIESHLADCPDCDAHVRFLLAVKRSLSRVGGPYSTV